MLCHLMKSTIAATMARVAAEPAAELMMMAVNIILSFSFVISLSLAILFLLASCPKDERLKHPNEVDCPDALS